MKVSPESSVASLKGIVWFAEVGKEDGALVGGKGANLGEMARVGLPVPLGFIVTAESYFAFLRATNLQGTLRRLLADLDPNHTEALQKTAERIKGAILESPLPEEIAEPIRLSYQRLGGGPVAVRSSATAEDLPDASFAGQQRTFLNVQGEEAVLRAVVGCWASLFEPRAIFYRAQQGFDHLQVGIAVPVQRMVQSEVSGVLFTCEPVTNDETTIAIEAVYGLGEAIVGGEVTPDLYLVSKSPLTVRERTTVLQGQRLVRAQGLEADLEMANVWEAVPASLREQPKLSQEQILELAELGLRTERHYGQPQDIEWAWAEGRFHLLQARPITTLRRGPEASVTLASSEQTLLLEGSPASPGIGIGPVRIVLHAQDLGSVRTGDILVTEMTTPDFVPAMRRAAAIVTDRGGRTCHAAIVSRELGIPCVVGTGNATTSLQEQQVITVDGARGKVYAGRVALAHPAAGAFQQGATLTTRTKVYVNLADPERAAQVAQMNVDGVGLLRAEFIIATYVQYHPRYLLADGRGQEFTDRLAEGLRRFVVPFAPRPVVYRTTDFKTNEYRGLRGGQRFEGEEENPMLGYRGVSRYLADRESFRLELAAIRQVRQDYPNLWVMLPFVRTVAELRSAKELLAEEGLVRGPDFQLWMMAEVPSNALLLDRFLDVGIDGISIGSNDLTQLILGVDRDNERLADLFDERNPAVLLALRKLITTARRRGVTCSICGQAPSDYPDLAEKLVRWGITSISVNTDAIYKTREIVANVEAKLAQRPSTRRKP